MSRIFVPPRVARELREETRQYQAELLMRAQMKGVMDSFNRDLKQIDPYLELMFFEDDVLLPGVTPGRWHVVRHNPGAPPSLDAYVGPNGEYLEPDSGIFKKLEESDLQNPMVNRERKRREHEAKLAYERRKAREREEINEETIERYLAATRTQVSMNRSTPWAQNFAGYRRTRKIR